MSFRELIISWRESAKKEYFSGAVFGDSNTGEPSYSDVYEECANQLEKELQKHEQEKE
jgi:hypothetical protein